MRSWGFGLNEGPGLGSGVFLLGAQAQASFRGVEGVSRSSYFRSDTMCNASDCRCVDVCVVPCFDCFCFWGHRLRIGVASVIWMRGLRSGPMDAGVEST